MCYHDCLNYYFEIETNDEDYVDEVTGELIKGLRKYKPSKEHRPNPIVEMGLFIDANAIPFSMCITHSSANEQTTTISLEKELTNMFKDQKFIYCADAGLESLDIRKFNFMGGRAFIVTQSIKKLSEKLNTAVFNNYDYKLLSNDESVTLEDMKSFDKNHKINSGFYNACTYKIIHPDCAVNLGFSELKELKNGKIKCVKSKVTLKQKVIITFSRKMMEYQRYIRNRQNERTRKLLKNINQKRFKKVLHDVTKFIRHTSCTKSGEKVSDVYEINQTVIDTEEKYDGFYAIATNLNDSAKDIVRISSKHYKIEDCFRVMKTNLAARPVFH